MDEEEQEQGQEDLEDRPFACEVFGCGKRFRRKDTLVYHSSIHTGVKNSKCTFPNCQSAFINNSKLKLHLKVHENPNPYVCTLCSEAFPKKNKLREHRLQSHNIAEFLCTIGL